MTEATTTTHAQIYYDPRMLRPILGHIPLRLGVMRCTTPEGERRWCGYYYRIGANVHARIWWNLVTHWDTPTELPPT